MLTKKSSIKTLEDITDLKKTFFKEVSESVRIRRLDVSDFAQSYLSDLLVKFLRSPSLFDGYEMDNNGRVEKFIQPIAFSYGVDGDQMKVLGDKCLFLTGFMYDWVRRNGMAQVRYYGEVGSSAYISYAKNRSETKRLFYELAGKFWDLSSVINDLRLPDDYSDSQMTDIYFKYLCEHDSRHKEILIKLGMVINDPDDNIS